MKKGIFVVSLTVYFNVVTGMIFPSFCADNPNEKIELFLGTLRSMVPYYKN